MTSLCMIPFWKKQKRNVYVEMVLITFTERIGNDNFIYQHDKAPVYTSKYTKRWLHEKELFSRFESHRKSQGNNCKKISCIAGNIIPLVNYQSIEKHYKICTNYQYGNSDEVIVNFHFVYLKSVLALQRVCILSSVKLYFYVIFIFVTSFNDIFDYINYIFLY